VVEITPENGLFSQVQQARDRGIFKKGINILEICNVILASNGFLPNEVPSGTKLLLDASLLQNYLTTALPLQ
jgi:hypothetical protein